jgi:hypothetical protein
MSGCPRAVGGNSDFLYFHLKNRINHQELTKKDLYQANFTKKTGSVDERVGFSHLFWVSLPVTLVLGYSVSRQITFLLSVVKGYCRHTESQ